MPISGFTHYCHWTCLDQHRQRGPHPHASESDPMDGVTSAGDVVPTYCELTTFGEGADESIYPQQWTTSRSGVNSCLNDLGDGYAENVTSFRVHDVTTMNDISRCDAVDDRGLFAGHYRCSPATLQKLEYGGQYGELLYNSGGNDARHECLEPVLAPCRQTSLSSSHNPATQFTPTTTVGLSDWHGDVEITESDASCNAISYRQSASLATHQLTTGTASGCERAEMESRSGLRSCYLEKQNEYLQSTPDVSLAGYSSDALQAPQSERERIKKEKHNRVEKRRRSNINEHMKTLGSLLPKKYITAVSGNRKFHQNKGNILKETVAYIRVLQQDQAKLVSVERRTRQLYSANRHIIARLKELEELLSTKDCFPQLSLSDYGLLVDDKDAYIKEEPSCTPVVNTSF